MYDDYIELRPGAVERLQKLLNDYFQADSTVTELVDAGSNPNFPTKGNDIFARMTSWCRGLLAFSKNWNLPSRQPSRRPVDRLGVCPVIPHAQTPQVGHDFVLLCVPFMQRAVKLHQAEVCRINSDQEFFRLLRYYYASQRGVKSWARLRRVQSIDFVKVSKTHSHLRDISGTSKREQRKI